MSRILFLCSGNTCRSPIAAGLAMNVFGPSHSILSAGAETSDGAPIARNAVLAAKSVGADIAGQTTQDMSNLDLASFDLIVIFRPSSAERAPLPSNVAVEYLDVADPYGQGLHEYEATARKIERGVRQVYVSDALRRSKAEPSKAASHSAGIFNRAAKLCEKEVYAFVRLELQLSVSQKATLGVLASAIETSKNSGTAMVDLISAVKAVNDVWVEMKHRTDPPSEKFISGLEAINEVFQLLELQRSGSLP